MIEQLKMITKVKTLSLWLGLVLSSLSPTPTFSQVKVQSSQGATNNTYNITNSGDNLTVSGGANMSIHNRVFLSVARYSNDLNTAVSAATTRGYSVKVDTSCSVSSDLTVPSNVALLVERNGSITVPTGKRLTINGPFVCGNWIAFLTNIDSIFFSQTSVNGVFPEWFGAKADSSTASGDAWKAAAGAQTGRKTIFGSPGVYNINDKITLQSNTRVLGNQTTLISSDTSDYIFTAGPLVKNIKIFGFITRYTHINAVRQPNTSAFYIRECDTLEISNNKIYGAPGMGIEVVASKSVQIFNNTVERTLADGIHITNGTNTDTGRDIWSQDFQIVNNQVFNPGDDGIACVSYQRPVPSGDTLSTGMGWTGSQEINRDGVISGNIVRGGHNRTRGRGISVLGGRDIVIDGNIIEGRSTVGDTNQTIRLTGILIQGATTPFRFWRPNRITVSNNIIKKSTANHFGSNFESENGGIKIQGADSIDVLGNTIDWSPYMWGIFVRGDTSLMSYGNWNTTPRDIRLINNKINNARVGIRLLNTNARLDSINTRWINRVTIKGNRLTNIQRQGITADSVKTLFIEDNELIGLNAANQANIDGIIVRRYGGNVVIRNNKFVAHGTGNTVSNCINASPATGPVVSGSHTATLYIKDNTFTGITASNANIVIPTTIKTIGMEEYGAVDYKADTLSVSTTYTQFQSYQNRSRSTATVNYGADSLKITNSGDYRISGQIVVASQDSNVTLIVGVSQNNSNPTDDALIVRGYLGDSDQIFTIPFNFYLNLSANTSIKPKIKTASGTHNIYIKRGWLTVESLADAGGGGGGGSSGTDSLANLIDVDISGAAAGNTLMMRANGVWVDSTAAGSGDITGVTAGSGLSGGGLSGDVTVGLNSQLSGQTIAITSDSVHVKSASLDSSHIKSLSIPGSKIVNATITTGKLADSLITGIKIKGNQIREEHITDGQVTTAKLEPYCVDSTVTGTGAITSTNIRTAAIGATQLAPTAVTPGAYTNTNLTVDADGRITAAANGATGGTLALDDLTDVDVTGAGTGNTLIRRASGTWVDSTSTGSGDITGVAAGSGLSGGGVSGDVALAVDTTSVLVQTKTENNSLYQAKGDTATYDASKTWVLNKDYQSRNDTTTFDATKTYVNAQGFLKASDSTGTTLQTKTEVASQITSAISGYQQDSDTTTFDASKTYVTNAIVSKQDDSDTTAFDASKTWVINRNYQAKSDTSTYDASKTWVLNKSYLVASDVSTKQDDSDTTAFDASKTWVLSKSYLVAADIASKQDDSDTTTFDASKTYVRNANLRDAGINWAQQNTDSVYSSIPAKLKTQTYSFSIVDTVKAADSFGIVKVPTAITITEIAGFTDAGTVTFNIEQRGETTPNTAGTDCMGTDLVADNDQQEQTSFAAANVSANTWLYFAASGVSGGADKVTITIRYTIN